MKRIALLAIAALALAGIWATTAASESAPHSTPPAEHSHAPPPRHCTIAGFRPFSAAVWRLGAWSRGRPPKRVLAARTAAYRCAPPAHRLAMQRTWRRDAKRYFAHAKDMRWFDKFRHYEYPDGKHWAVPWPIATCESGDPSTGIPSGNYYASSAGAYGLTAGGGFPQNMPPKMQDEYAYRQFQESGEAAWAPFEGGCPLR